MRLEPFDLQKRKPLEHEEELSELLKQAVLLVKENNPDLYYQIKDEKAALDLAIVQNRSENIQMCMELGYLPDLPEFFPYYISPNDFAEFINRVEDEMIQALMGDVDLMTPEQAQRFIEKLGPIVTAKTVKEGHVYYRKLLKEKRHEPRQLYE